MVPSSRTPEGLPNLCPICGNQVHISPSRPSGDAPCPRCGHLLWFDCQDKNARAPDRKKQKARRRSLAASPSAGNDASERPDSPAPETARQGKFTLVDFRKTMGQLKKLGPLQSIMRWIPGMGTIADMMGSGDLDPHQDLKQIEGIIDAMTLDERRFPDLIDFSRRTRIALGSGTDAVAVERLLTEFRLMAGMMGQMVGLNKLQQMRQIKQMADGGLFNPGAQLQRPARPQTYRRP